MTRYATRLGTFALVVVAAMSMAGGSHAQEPARTDRAQVDRVVVRFWAPETGGSQKPRFITERVLAFEARLEALGEESFGPSSAFQERHVRAAIDRHVAEELLATLMIEHGTEPKDLPQRAERALAAMTDRAGGQAAFESAVSAEGLDDSEVTQLVRRQARAAYYVDRSLVPILHPSEEELREIFHTDAHPFKGQKLDDVRERFHRWLTLERLRQAELGFLQAARSRVSIVLVSASK